jgi:CRP-like cAMP-binding protein
MNLRSVELFKDFSDQELERFTGVVEQLELSLGDMLFEEGDPGDALYIIEEGAVRIFKTIDKASGDEKSLALLEPGTYLGEMTLIDGNPRSASARAEIPSKIIKITRDNFLRLLREYPQAAIRLFVSFMQVISQRLRQTNDELVVMYQVGKLIGAAPPTAELVRGILERTMAGTGSAWGVFFCVNDITGNLEVAEAIGKGFESVLGLKTGLHQGLAGLCIQEGQVLKIDNIDDDIWTEDLPRFGYERKTMIAAPLLRKDTPIGALLLGDPMNAPEFNSANVNLVEAVTSEAAASLEASLMKADAASREKYDRHFFRF